MKTKIAFITVVLVLLFLSICPLGTAIKEKIDNRCPNTADNVFEYCGE